MKYNIIYADPGWKYDNQRTGGSHKSGAAQKYTVMTVDEICRLPVPYMMQPAVQTAPPDLFTSMLKVAYKLGAGEELTNDEHDFFADFCMMTRAATAHDFIQLERKLENHWYVNMPLGESRKYSQNKKNNLVIGNTNNE